MPVNARSAQAESRGTTRGFVFAEGCLLHGKQRFGTSKVESDESFVLVAEGNNKSRCAAAGVADGSIRCNVLEILFGAHLRKVLKFDRNKSQLTTYDEL